MGLVIVVVLLYAATGLQRLSPPRGAGWEPENIDILRAKKSH
jgi:hypothetical protein